MHCQRFVKDSGSDSYFWLAHYESWLQVSLKQSCRLVGMAAPRSHVGCSTNRFCFWFLDSFFGNGWMEWILLVQTGNVGLVTNIPTAEYLSAWQVLGNLVIAEVLRDYIASNHQREQICLFLSSWLGISKWTQVQGFNVAYAKSTIRHRIDSLNVRNAKNASTLHAQTLVTTNSSLMKKTGLLRTPLYSYHKAAASLLQTLPQGYSDL